MKTALNFKMQAKKLGIKRWNIRTCSICNRWIGYIFQDDIVRFDSSCECASSIPSLRSWEAVAEHYAELMGENLLQADSFWEFDNIAEKDIWILANELSKFGELEEVGPELENGKDLFIVKIKGFKNKIDNIMEVWKVINDYAPRYKIIDRLVIDDGIYDLSLKVE